MKELLENAKKATIKTFFIVFSGLLFAAVFWLMSRKFEPYWNLAESLNHHACSANGAFVAFAIGISQVLLPLCIVPFIEHHWRFFLRTMNEMAGHLTLASLGFATVFWLQQIRIIDIGIGLVWLLGGWLCVLNGVMFEKTIDTTENLKMQKRVAPVALYANFCLGAVLLYWGVVAGAGLKPLPGCISYFH